MTIHWQISAFPAAGVRGGYATTSLKGPGLGPFSAASRVKPSGTKESPYGRFKKVSNMSRKKSLALAASRPTGQSVGSGFSCLDGPLLGANSSRCRDSRKRWLMKVLRPLVLAFLNSAHCPTGCIGPDGSLGAGPIECLVSQGAYANLQCLRRPQNCGGSCSHRSHGPRQRRVRTCRRHRSAGSPCGLSAD